MSELVKQDPGGVTLPAPSGVDLLLEQAIANNLDIDKLERLLALKERHEAGEARKEFYAAMSRFQRDCPVITKSKSADRYKYAPLSDIVAQVRDLEARQGFSHRFDQIMKDDGSLDVTCYVTHDGGHSESTTIPVPATQGRGTSSAQNIGIMATYGMRYAFCGAMGITTADEDMDGRLPQSHEPITDAQALDLHARITETETDMAGFLRWAGVETLEELPASKFRQAVTLLQKKATQS